MADIKTVCGECGVENTFSEYSKPESRICRQCGASLASENKVERKKLQLRKMEEGEDGKATLRGAADSKKTKLPEQPDSDTGPKKKDPARTRSNKPASFLLGIFTFIVVAAGLVGLQYAAQDDPKLMEIYRYVRLGALALAYLVVVVNAFIDGQISGFLALLLPPYTIYYALGKLDSFWSQGLFFAVVIMLAAEMYFMRGDALITHCNNYLQQQIDNVSQQLDKAGNAPIPKL